MQTAAQLPGVRLPVEFTLTTEQDEPQRDTHTSAGWFGPVTSCPAIRCHSRLAKSHAADVTAKELGADPAAATAKFLMSCGITVVQLAHTAQNMNSTNNAHSCYS